VSDRIARRAVTVMNYIRQQRDWISRCGGDLAGYVARYGDSSASPSRPVAEGGRYGDGGQRIYEADINQLRAYEMEYETLTGHRY
jgi:hypothetical protein